MGNESSQLTGLEIDEKAVEVTDFWIHSSASLYNENVTTLSVFSGDSFVEGPLWVNQTPLEKMTKNLMLHRHPCILKYVSSWTKGSKHYLVVEQVKPLAHAISSQTPLQICIGLYSILKAITFLHEKAHSSHNNICSASIYVTKDGSWKLGGLEYLCKYEDLNAEYLNKTRAYRYDKGVDPNEQTNAKDQAYLKSGAIDKYAFSVLVQELLHLTRKNDDIPSLGDFKQFCKTELQTKNVTSLPSFSSLLEHSYFNNEFIIIYSFLTELALKTESEKKEFFKELAIKLRIFPEEILARQLGELLLSRLVLLDDTACKHLLPYILTPRTDNAEEECPVFSVETFKQYIVPKLLHIFCVRDAQIRLLLLSHFKNYIAYFSKEQLQNHILPELLIGIKDTNDHLVSVTLRALADLVPLLGAAIVIGGKRLRLFNDGRPNTLTTLPRVIEKPIPRLSEVSIHTESRSSSSETNISYVSQVLELPERLSPDGGEDEVISPESEHIIAEEDLESWSDWDAEENTSSYVAVEQDHLPPIESIAQAVEEQIPPLNLSNKLPPRTEITTDITSLDIKTLQTNNTEVGNEFNYFLDMEPVIEKTNKFFIEEKQGKKDEDEGSKIVLAMRVTEDTQLDEVECWGEDLSWVEN